MFKKIMKQIRHLSYGSSKRRYRSFHRGSGSSSRRHKHYPLSGSKRYKRRSRSSS
ncbi:hypothetical protein [Virgibacillus doumboii]|uniref:hypothetical protein n=1 Tax=Virgibacillus doumboii TaxID=2697503 RepID=UPI0013E02BA3|nr:hypothetical protein [Virgibacillus doumboii]